MNFRIFPAIATVVGLSLLLPIQAGCQDKEAPDVFLKRYFQALHSAKSVEELMSYYPAISEEAKKQKEEFDNALPEMKKMIERILLGMGKQEPRTVKIISKTVKDGKVYFSLAPDEIPADFKTQVSKPKFEMNGSLSLVQENG